MNLTFKCQQQDHDDDIETVCFNQYCSEFRLNCFKCIQKGGHSAHIHNIEKINRLVDYIENQNQECAQFIDDLNINVKNLHQSFLKLKSGIKNKYSFLKERLVNLNSEQINDFLNSNIKFIELKQSIKTLISKEIQRLTDFFNTQYEELELQSFNSYQNYDENIQISKIYYDQGYELYLYDNYQQAIQILNQSIALDSNNYLPLWCKGACLVELEKYEDAIIWFDKALDINPWHIGSLCDKGICLREQNQYNESIKLFDQALSIDKNHFGSLGGKGKCLQDQQKYNEALIYYEKSLTINPNDEWTNFQKNFCINQLMQ